MEAARWARRGHGNSLPRSPSSPWQPWRRGGALSPPEAAGLRGHALHRFGPALRPEPDGGRGERKNGRGHEPAPGDGLPQGHRGRRRRPARRRRPRRPRRQRRRAGRGRRLAPVHGGFRRRRSRPRSASRSTSFPATTTAGTRGSCGGASASATSSGPASWPLRPTASAIPGIGARSTSSAWASTPAPTATRSSTRGAGVPTGPGGCPGHSLEFLEEDLARRVGASGRPVVLLQHYGWDAWGLGWWSDREREALRAAVKGYHVIAAFYGHSHVMMRVDLDGYPGLLRRLDPVRPAARVLPRRPHPAQGDGRGRAQG